MINERGAISKKLKIKRGDKESDERKRRANDNKEKIAREASDKHNNKGNNNSNKH